MADLTGTPTTLGIGTYNVDADAPSGLGFNEAMAQIDALIAARVGKPSGIAAGEVPVWNGSGWDRSSVTHIGASSLGSGTPDATKFLRGDGSWQIVSAGAPTGSVTAFAAATAPSGWSLLDGTARKRSGVDPGDSQDYSALYALISTTYGTGDGSTTFNLPDLRGRMPFGKGPHADVSALGNNEGQATAANRRPKHRTSLTDPGHFHSATVDAGGTGAAFASGDGSTHNSTGNTGSKVTGITVGSGNANDPLDSAPYLVLNYIIKL